MAPKSKEVMLRELLDKFLSDNPDRKCSQQEFSKLYEEWFTARTRTPVLPGTVPPVTARGKRRRIDRQRQQQIAAAATAVTQVCKI